MIPWACHKGIWVHLSVSPELLAPQEQAHFISGLALGRNSMKSSMKCMGTLTYPRAQTRHQDPCPTEVKTLAQREHMKAQLVHPGLSAYKSPNSCPVESASIPYSATMSGASPSSLSPQPSNPCTSPAQSCPSVQLQKHLDMGLEAQVLALLLTSLPCDFG